MDHKEGNMGFCTVVNCMDGRVQLPVINYLRELFRVEYVDSITEPGPVRILAEEKPACLFDSIINRIKLSIERHGSRSIAVVGHYDCAGNPLPRVEQEAQIKRAVRCLVKEFPNVEVVGIWVDEKWEVHKLVI